MKRRTVLIPLVSLAVFVTAVPIVRLTQIAVTLHKAQRCWNNLRLIDDAKDEFLLNNRSSLPKPLEQFVPTEEQVRLCLKSKELPKCPCGGVYAMNSVSEIPSCSFPGHLIRYEDPPPKRNLAWWRSKGLQFSLFPCRRFDWILITLYWLAIAGSAILSGPEKRKDE